MKFQRELVYGHILSLLEHQLPARPFLIGLYFAKIFLSRHLDLLIYTNYHSLGLHILLQVNH